jgi:hypothetical protein
MLLIAAASSGSRRSRRRAATSPTCCSRRSSSAGASVSRSSRDGRGRDRTRPDEAGLASGLINTAQQVGGALGLAILAAVANGRTSDALASGVRNPAVALTEGFHDAFLVGAGFASWARCSPR